MNNSNIKRNTVFIQKKFQMRSIATVVSIIAASGLLSGIFLYFMLSNELSSELQAAHLQIKNTWDALAPVIIFGNIITIVITGVVAAFAVLYQSHKIAGPMYRLQNICDEVSQGNYNPVSSLRKADQLTALAESFEHMLISLRNKHTQQTELIDEIETTLTILIEQDISENQKTLLTDMQQKISQIIDR